MSYDNNRPTVFFYSTVDKLQNQIMEIYQGTGRELNRETAEYRGALDNDDVAAMQAAGLEPGDDDQLLKWAIHRGLVNLPEPFNFYFVPD